MNEMALAIERNSVAQHRNNQARIEALRRYSSPEYVRVFDQIPESLHCNSPEVIGYVPDPETPHGLRGFERQLWRWPADRAAGLSPAGQPVAEALFLIGSPGTVGYNSDSDLDYWVCYEDGVFTPRSFELFQRKLAGLKDWAVRECGVEANFYSVNLADLARGHITHRSNAETEGEVAPLLLLEEFYRTFLLVSGKLPLWPVMPLDLARDHYEEAAAALAREGRSEFLDLGFPALPAPQQILAAALWLAHKSEADPFKGLAKLTVLLEYVENNFQCPLLCAEVKAAVLTAPEANLPVDPYVVTIERVTGFGQGALTAVHLDLLRTAAIFKVLGATSNRLVTPLPPSSPKSLILKKWLNLWGWPQERLDHYAAYSLWAERGRLELSHETLQALVRLYIRIANHLTSHYPQEIDPQNKELTPFAARLLTRQSGLEATLESLSVQVHRGMVEGRLALRPEPESHIWTLHTLTAENQTAGADNLIYASHRAARVAAWLVHNQFTPNQIDRLEVWPAQADGQLVKLDDLPGLFDELSALFPPIDLNQEEEIWAARPQGLVLLALNFEEGTFADGVIRTVDIIMRTGWGEMRHEFLSLGQEVSLADRYLKIAQAILKGGEVRPENLVFHAQNSFTHEARQAIVNIRGSLTATIKLNTVSTSAANRLRRMDL